jgi:xanthine dehydrogenase small subunit
MTVLQYLRLVEKRCGTKEGCAEGDCGACTVVLGELDGEGMRYRAVNSCIQFLPTLDGKHLLTVEDLEDDSGTLHPVQAAMVRTDGSQCGFCTPGFVMSLYALYLNDRDPGLDEINEALAGNLCRCTGYGPIIEAARQMSRDAASATATEAALRSAEQLSAAPASAGIAAEFAGRRYFAPKTAGDLAALLVEHPGATLLAGGTDVGLWVTKQHRELETVIYIGEVRKLGEISDDGEALIIGATATYSDALSALADVHGDIGEMMRRLGSRQIRNVGTIGGNIANGSPIGDMPPPLIALGATISLRRGTQRRELALEDFFIDYGVQDRAPDEFVEEIRVPRCGPDAHFAVYKISKRFDQDISAVCAAFYVSLADGVVTGARICFGGMAATPKRAAGCEAALIGKSWTEATVKVAMQALESDYTPMTDMRSSAEYRSKVAQSLLFKFFIESNDPGVATRVIGAGGQA